MAKCKTCGKTIRVPKGWTIGPAVRKHYWRAHTDVMERAHADRKAEESLPARRRARHPDTRKVSPGVAPNSRQ